jgi:hypothetical protein
MKTRRIPLAIAVAAALLTPNSVALAAALGEVATLSALGERFRAEIQLVGSGGIQASCFRVVPPGDTSAGIPGLTSGRVSIVGQGANVRLVVRDDRAVSDPVLQLAIENVCEARLRREYTLLMPFTAAKPVSAPVSTVPARKPAATRSPPATPRGGTASAPKARPQQTAVRTWSTAPGESLESLGEALYPDDPSARERFRAATAAANPGLFPDSGTYDKALPAGTRVVIPNMRQVANGAPIKARAPAAAGEARPGAAQPARNTEDRVIVDKTVTPAPRVLSATNASPDAVRPEGDDRSENLLGRERDLAAAIDRSIIAEMELLARIKELEDLQAALETRLRSTLAAAPPTPSAPATQQAATSVPAAASAPPPPPIAHAAPTSSANDAYLLAGLGLATLLLAALLLRRRRGTLPAADALAPTAARRSTPAATPAYDRTPTPDTVTNTRFAGDVIAPSADQQPAAGTVVEEHKSAVELADIMMSFGRVQGAAETLAEFIRGNPREAVTPWLKLLEVYRAAGLRAEFEAIAGELNKTFNVNAVNWNNYQTLRAERTSLEDLPHIAETLQKSWRTTACQRYLQQLLRDNRDGTRVGFPFTVIDEILTLSAILEEDLGPCPRPSETLKTRR